MAGQVQLYIYIYVTLPAGPHLKTNSGSTAIILVLMKLCKTNGKDASQEPVARYGHLTSRRSILLSGESSWLVIDEELLTEVTGNSAW